LTDFRSNITTARSLPEVANPWPLEGTIACHLTEQLAVVLVDRHDPTLARDEQPVVWRVGDDVVPGALAAE
jgi:hypothetical protein